MAWHRERGDEVNLVIVTRGITELWTDDATEGTRREAVAASALLGVNQLRFLDFPAPVLDQVPKYKLADAIRKVLLEFRPEIIYLPHRGDIHHDHRAVYWATCVAARPTVEYAPQRLLSYETPSETEWAAPGDDAFAPTIFVDISAHIDAKMRAMSYYSSQMQAAPHPRSLENAKALARYRGGAICAEYAEAFVLVREVVRL